MTPNDRLADGLLLERTRLREMCFLSYQAHLHTCARHTAQVEELSAQLTDLRTQASHAQQRHAVDVASLEHTLHMLSARGNAETHVRLLISRIVTDCASRNTAGAVC